MLMMRRAAVRHAALLFRLEAWFRHVLTMARPLLEWVGLARLERPFAIMERAIKGFLFDCRMCGDCMLARNGMACPMNCPKGMRNGPCGGVKADGACEIDSTLRCVWVEGWSGARRAAKAAAFREPARPVETHLRGRSAWMRVLGEMPKDAARFAADDVKTSPSLPMGSFEALLRQGQFVVTSELSPPDSADPDEISRRAEVFLGLVDAVNVPDASGANCHMSSLASSVLLLRLGLTPVMQYACRDRNRIALQGDILGASALGIVNLLCLTGDAVEAGDHHGAKPVFDLDAVSLLQAARTMRDDGHFLSGRPLTKTPPLFLGGAANPFAPPFEARPYRLARKITAGAQFVQTQFCYDVTRLEQYMAEVRALGLHTQCSVIIGVGPLTSARSAKWIRAHVPGVYIPDAVIARLEDASDERREGKRICLEMIEASRQIEGVAGVHVMAHKNEDLLAEIIRDSGLRVGN